MTRTSLCLGVVALLGSAPIQCKSDDPASAREDTPGEALMALCGRFAAAKDEAAARATLDYLIERYPSSRMAERARQEKSAEHPCATVAAESGAAGQPSASSSAK